MNIYLITGKSNKLIKDEIDKIVSKGEVVTFNFRTNSISEILEEASYQFFLDEKKYIVVKNADFVSSGKLDEASEKRLLAYLDGYNEQVVLIFTSEEVDNRKKIVKFIKEKFKFIPITIDYKNVYDYINTYVNKNKYKSEYKINNFLVNLYGLNIDLIFNELDKVFLFYNNPCLLQFDIVKDIVSKPLEDNVFHFIDAVVNKQENKIFSILNDLKIHKIDSSYLVILLARQFRLIFYVKTMYENKYSLKDILSTLKLQEWQLNKIYKETLNFTSDELKNLLLKLAKIDAKIKTGQVDKDIALNTFILDVIA